MGVEPKNHPARNAIIHSVKSVQQSAETLVMASRYSCISIFPLASYGCFQK